jgi:predicted NAD/FAD-binding protein
MRAFTGGYYRNLKAMYDHIGVRYRRQKFRFVFSKDELNVGEGGVANRSRTYFIHASDNHEIPPPRPRAVGMVAYLFELVFVVACYVWFTICCQLVSASRPSETLEEYLRRIRLSHRFVSYYLLPLMSAVATCSHQELLAFPARDVVGYRRLITTNKQYVVCGGVGQVQRILTQDLDIKTRARVDRIESSGSGVQVTAEMQDEDGQIRKMEQTFDLVIMAVPPNVAATIFEPARTHIGRIPVRIVETIAHSIDKKNVEDQATSDADHILLRTSNETGGWTEATHVQQCSVAVTSCPMANSSPRQLLSKTWFTRSLRTPESREIVQQAFDCKSFPQYTQAEKPKPWQNGDLDVWMVGAWCWDGMVLLEGAMVSALRVAKALDVEIPWERNT